MKIIKYEVKDTSATTQYRKMLPDDMKYILDSLKNMNAMLNTCRNSNEQDLLDIYHDFCKNNLTLPRRTQPKFAPNSVVTFVEGVLDNLGKNGTQRDLSDKTCKGLVEVFLRMSDVFKNYEEIKFIETDDLHKKEHTAEMPPIPTTFSDLFEITITIKKK